jgi:molecular chaperone DnaJ
VTCPQCKGTGNVSQMAGAMRFSLTCPRCGGTGRLRNACPTCGGDGRVTRTELVDVRIPPGARNGSRLRVRARATPAPWARLRAIFTSPPRWKSTPSSTARATTSKSRSGGRVGSGAGRQDRGAHHRWPHAAEDSARHHQRPAFRLREKGVQGSRTGQRGDQIVEVAMEAPDPRDERTRELLRELRELHPEDPRADLWSKV